MNSFILTVRSKCTEDEPQYTVHLAQPQANERLASLFYLVRSVYDSLSFRLENGRFVFVSDGDNIQDTTWHTDLGRMIEKHFQDELRQIMHADWDNFSLIWNSENYPEWTGQ